MNRFNMTVVAAIAASVAIAGCASGAGGGVVQVRTAAGSSVVPAAAGQIAVGQGPTNYTVRTQPPAGSCQYRYSNAGEPLPDPAAAVL